MPAAHPHPARVRRATVVVATAFTLLTLLTAAGTGSRVDTRMDPVDAYLAQHPGGTRINDNEISYGDGRFIVTVTRPAGTQAAADCPSGWFCFYDRINFGYPRGRLSDCGWQDLAWWGWQDETEAAHYNLATGTVWFINHGAGTSHTSDQRLFDLGVGLRTRADVAPYRNMADHVYRFC